MTVEQDSKYALRGTLQAPEATKIIQQGDSRIPNQIEMPDETTRLKVQESNTPSATHKAPLKASERSEEYNIPFASQIPQIPKFREISANQKQADKSRRKLRQNDRNFRTSEAVNKVRSLGSLSH